MKGLWRLPMRWSAGQREKSADRFRRLRGSTGEPEGHWANAEQALRACCGLRFTTRQLRLTFDTQELSASLTGSEVET